MVLSSYFHLPWSEIFSKGTQIWKKKKQHAYTYAQKEYKYIILTDTHKIVL